MAGIRAIGNLTSRQPHGIGDDLRRPVSLPQPDPEKLFQFVSPSFEHGD
jgi:hypothetical protein